MSTPELPSPDFALMRLAELADRLDTAEAGIADLAERVAEILAEEARGGRGYKPIPAPEWWRLSDRERDVAIERLAAWVEQVLRPSYGTLAAALPPCWAEHPLVLFALDWLSSCTPCCTCSQAAPRRCSPARAEFQTRLLPAAIDQIKTECARCDHRRPR